MVYEKEADLHDFNKDKDVDKDVFLCSTLYKGAIDTITWFYASEMDWVDQ